jgi:hypothetical protein
MEKATARVGETLKVRVKVTDVVSGEARADLQDLGVLVFLAPGIWQNRAPAKSIGSGIYEMSFVPPEAGVYYVYFQCPSLSVQYNKIPPFTLQVVAQ